VKCVVAAVPAWNARDRIAEVLDALAEQVTATVVVDNGSTDGTADWVAANRPSAILLRHDQNLGFSAAVNRAIDQAASLRPDALLLVNDDAVFAPGAVDLLAGALDREARAGAVSAKMLYRDRPGVINGTGGFFDASRGWAALRGEGEPDSGQYDDQLLVDYPSGAASLLRWAALLDVGPFDEDYFLYFEDTDWGLRSRASGWLTLYEPRAVVTHEGSAGTAADPARRRYYNVRNRLLLASRHATLRGRCVAWAETLCLLAKQPLRWPYQHRRRDAEAVFLGVQDHLRGRYGRGAVFG